MSKTKLAPSITLFNGHKMPVLGLGTWGSSKGEVAQAVKDAIDIGYRHIDCALVYGNETEVGEGIKAKIDEGVIKREDIFVTSKLWNTFHGTALVRVACEKSLNALGLAYLDMYLIHCPTAYRAGDDLFPTGPDGKTIFSFADYVDTWKGMEELVTLGLTKSIGVSNFNKRQIERILAISTIQPAINQVECHPYLNQKKLMDFCKSNKIQITAYSPLGSPNRPWAKPEDPKLLEDANILALAKINNKTPAQLLIRYQIDRGNIVIPKSTKKSHIESNFEALNFQLTKSELEFFETFNKVIRFVPMTKQLGHPHHPFEFDDY